MSFNTEHKTVHLKWAIETAEYWTKSPLCLDPRGGLFALFPESEKFMKEAVLDYVGRVADALKDEGHPLVAAELLQTADAARDAARAIDGAGVGGASKIPENLIQEARRAGEALCQELTHISDWISNWLTADRKPIRPLGAASKTAPDDDGQQAPAQAAQSERAGTTLPAMSKAEPNPENVTTVSAPHAGEPWLDLVDLSPDGILAKCDLILEFISFQPRWDPLTEDPPDPNFNDLVGTLAVAATERGLKSEAAEMRRYSLKGSEAGRFIEAIRSLEDQLRAEVLRRLRKEREKPPSTNKIAPTTPAPAGGPSTAAGVEVRAVVPSPATAPPAAAQPPTPDVLVATLDEKAILSPATIAEKVGLNPEAVRKRLERFRKTHKDCFIENVDRSSTEPQYLYRIGKVRQEIKAMIASGKASGKRPAQK